MIIERDVAVGVRGGVTVYADVFRPVDELPAPPLIAWSPYGKHAGSQVTERYPDGGVAPGQLSQYTAFESPDPLYWTARGYAVINADIPGSWHSGGDATFLSPEEVACGHDLIEWAAAQPWSNGKVGMSGVSYLTSAQWSIAATSPPHLAAINPWEGWSDTYREVARHGGIPETYFWPYIGPAVGLRDRPGRGPGGGIRGAPILRRFLGQQGRGPVTDHRARLRRGQLVRPGPAHPGHVRGVQADQLAAQVARRPRR
jgi:putative CocE/NonD family hydrolase